MLKTDKVKVVKDAPRDKVKVVNYTLSLTADELTWLLLEVFPAAIRNADGSFATEMRYTRNAWGDEAYKQGWEGPF